MNAASPRPSAVPPLKRTTTTARPDTPAGQPAAPFDPSVNGGTPAPPFIPFANGASSVPPTSFSLTLRALGDKLKV